jgi:hypothetical protein
MGMLGHMYDIGCFGYESILVETGVLGHIVVYVKKRTDPVHLNSSHLNLFQKHSKIASIKVILDRQSMSCSLMYLEAGP